MGRTIARIALMVLGFFFAFSGSFWALQGLGIIMWPPESFMLADRSWTLYGGITALIGIVLMWLSTRLK